MNALAQYIQRRMRDHIQRGGDGFVIILPRFGQDQTGRGAFDESDSDPFLEGSQMPAEDRMVPVEPFGGFAYTSQTRDGIKCPQALEWR